MTSTIGRRTFLQGAGALAAGVAIGGPLQAFAARAALGAPVRTTGYGELVDKGDLFLPQGFRYRVISQQGDLMSDGHPTPSRFDGMVAFRRGDDETILMRNHENKRRLTPAGPFSPANEIDVVVPDELRYDPNPLWNAGVVRLVVEDRKVEDSRAVLGGTTHNCAGGPTPWKSWITCEELFQPPPAPAGPVSERHGYIFEVDTRRKAPTAAVPVTSAGRFEHEAVAWLDGVLYETEDRPSACFYRYIPSSTPAKAGDLASANSGQLQALVVSGFPNLDTRTASGWPGGVGAIHPVEWVTVPEPDPATDAAGQGVRFQSQAQGAAIFARTEGCWASRKKIYFDCTTGGGTTVTPAPDGNGQVFALDPVSNTLTLVYQSTGPVSLAKPDNMVLARTGDLFLCEDNPVTLTQPNRIIGLTRDGAVFEFARAGTNPTEFCGVCFDPNGKTMYVNQQGNADGAMGVTYAIWGPWKRRRRDD
jgi:secreted PhoX family phosphatase